MTGFVTALRRLPLVAKMAVGILIVALLGFLVWFAGPLFYNRTVNEPFPVAMAAPTAAMAAPTAAAMAKPTAEVMAKPTAAAMAAPTAAAMAAPTAAMAKPTAEVMTKPTAAPEPTAAPKPEPTAAPTGPTVVQTGNFVAGKVRGDQAGGAATFYKLEDGRTVLRLEAFSATNGPDLVVSLSASANPVEAGFKNAPYLTLAALKGNQGNQTYELPADLDLRAYRSVVIWCRSFDVVFGYAPLG